MSKFHSKLHHWDYQGPKATWFISLLESTKTQAPQAALDGSPKTDHGDDYRFWPSRSPTKTQSAAPTLKDIENFDNNLSELNKVSLAIGAAVGRCRHVIALEAYSLSNLFEASQKVRTRVVQHLRKSWATNIDRHFLLDPTRSACGQGWALP
jgi:hypothetical protein